MAEHQLLRPLRLTFTSPAPARGLWREPIFTTAHTTVNGGALRLQNSSALGSGLSTFASTAVTVTGGTATGRIELDGSLSALNIARAITLQGRSAPSAVHLENVTGSNTVSGDISLVTGGDQYVIQSDAGTLTLNTITNNTASVTPRYVTLQAQAADRSAA